MKSASIFDEINEGDFKTEEKNDEIVSENSSKSTNIDKIINKNNSSNKHINNPTVDEFNIDKKIDNSKQGNTGDCWLLAGLNSLSYSENGRKMLEEAITIKSDCFEVTFKGVNTTVTITPQEMREAKNSGKYSSGDDDVLLMELACEKVMDDVKLGRISSPEFLTKDAKDGETSITAGSFNDLIYLLTGEEASYQYNCYHPDYDDFAAGVQRIFPWLTKLLGNSMENVYDKIEKNPENIVAFISFCGEEGSKENIVIKDVDGNDVVLTHGDSGHAWSIKAVDGNNVILVNPWNSSKEIVISKSEIKKYATGINYYEW